MPAVCPLSSSPAPPGRRYANVIGTGVAWSKRGTREVKFLRWGEAPDMVKTPTRLFYRDQEVVGWGLKAPDHQSTDVSVRDWFKLDLDQGLERLDNVRPLYVKFMEKLHAEISGRYAS